MAKDSSNQLNRSPVTLKTYLPPKKPFHVFTFGICLGIYVLYSRKNNLYPGSTPYELVFKHVQKFTDFAIWAKPFVFYPVLGIHFVEAIVMAFKLEKHSVPRFSGVWWAWTASTFIEGFCAFQRIGEYIKLKEKGIQL